MNWTEEQQKVIASRNPEVLVSAAAGSGKTAVLAQRVADMVIHDGLQMENLLVLTFTKASAGDMREKIEEALLKSSRDESLSTEQRESCIEEAQHITLAQISTIDSWCNRIVREHFPLVSVSPDYAVCAEEDKEVLKEESMKLALDEFYEKAAENESHQRFIENYPAREVKEMLSTLFDYVMARPNPEKWLAEKCSSALTDQDTETGPIAKLLCEHFEKLLNVSLMEMEALDRVIAACSVNGQEKYEAYAAGNADILETFRGCLGKKLSAWLEAAKGMKPPRRPTVKRQNEQDEYLHDQVEKRNGKVHLILDTVRKFQWIGEESTADLRDTGYALDALADLARLMLHYNEETKRRVNMLEFADIEQYAHRLLSMEEICAQEQKKAKAVFVDEYQDVNPLQEDLLQKLKHEGGTIFYVGDVKQSIYRFRNAQPKSFLQKLKNFSDDEDAPQRRIILSKNFRSAKSVLDSANRVMEGIMRENLTELEYDDKARLYQGRQVENAYATLLIDLEQTKQPDEDSEMQLYREVYVASEQIRRIRQEGIVYTDNGSRPALYSDIAVIMPKKKLSPAMQAMLHLLNIEAKSDRESSVYEYREIRDLIEFLTLMTHEKDEEAFYCVLRSWLFGFTADEIARIRMADREVSLAEAAGLLSADQASGELGRKLKEAFAFLKKERYRIRNSNLFRYLWDFTRRTGLYEQVKNLKDAQRITIALDQIIFEAISFEEQSFRGIDAFVAKLRRRCEIKLEGKAVKADDNADLVHMMTIHKSKGLQYPFVIIIGLGENMRGKRDISPIKFNERLGVGLRYYDSGLHVYRDTIQTEAIKIANDNEERAESARLLYVAMTRASQQTILIGSAAPEEYDCEGISPYEVLTASAYMDWLRPCVRATDRFVSSAGETAAAPYQQAEDSPWIVQKIGNIKAINPFAEPFRKESAFKLPDCVAQAQKSEGPEALGFEPFEYEKQISKSLPGIQFAHLPRSVTPSMVNKATQQGMRLPRDEEQIRALMRIPQFELPKAEEVPLPELRQPRLSGLQDEESRVTARGTATHRLLQLCSYERIREMVTLPQLMRVLKEEVNRLYERGQITGEDRENADIRMAARFFLHPVAQKALRAKQCYREKNFFCYFLPPLTNMLLRGSIDLCYYDEEDEPGWVILDYKTDRFEEESELLEKYRGQLECYLKGIRMATGQHVKTCGLFALRTGSLVTMELEDADAISTEKVK